MTTGKRFFRMVCVRSRPDIGLAVLGVITGIAEIFVSNHFRLNRAYFGYTIVLACLFYLLFPRVFSAAQAAPARPVQRHAGEVFAALSGLSWALLGMSVLLLRASTSYVREVPYVIFFLGAVAVTVLQIVFFDTRSAWKQRLMICQILLLGIGFKASGFFLYPTMTGNDPFYHLAFVQHLVDAQTIPPGEAYTSFPLLHVLITVFSLVTSSDLKTSFFFISVLQSLSFVTVFVIGKVLFDQKTGMLAFLLLSLSDYQIEWGIQIIPMTVGVIVFALILMSVVLRSRYRKSFRMKWSALLMLWVVVMIFTHTLSTLIMMFSIFFLFISFVFFQRHHPPQGRRPFISLTFMWIAMIVPLGYWSYNTAATEQTFLAKVVLTIQMSLREAYLGDVQMISGAGALAEWQVALGDLGWVMLLLLTVIGILGSLRLYRQHATILSLVVLTGVLVFTTYGGALLGLRHILPARWISFLYVPACIFSAFGVKQILYTPLARLDFPLVRVLQKGWVSLIVWLTAGLMATSPLRSMPDSPLYLDTLSVRPGFYAAEVRGMEHALQQRGQVAASSKTGRYLKGITEIDPRKTDSYQNSAVILVREFDLRNGFFIPYPDYKVSDYVMPTQAFVDFLDDSCRRSYDNGEVTLFTVE